MNDDDEHTFRAATKMLAILLELPPEARALAMQTVQLGLTGALDERPIDAPARRRVIN